MSECQCDNPVIQCGAAGCRCTLCGEPARLPIATPAPSAATGETGKCRECGWSGPILALDEGSCPSCGHGWIESATSPDPDAVRVIDAKIEALKKIAGWQTNKRVSQGLDIVIGHLISVRNDVASLSKPAEVQAEREAQSGCEDCSRPYDSGGFPDLIIPYDVWKQISTKGDDSGLLCPSCICQRLHAKGIRCEGAFMSGPIISVSESTMNALRRVENIELALDGRNNRWAAALSPGAGKSERQK